MRGKQKARQVGGLAGISLGLALRVQCQVYVTVHVLVQQVAEVAWAAGVAGLRAEGAQPHEVAGFHFDPVLVQTVHCLAFQHVQAVFHHVGFCERNHTARLEGDDVHVHVVAHVGHVDKAGGFPAAFGARHLDDGGVVAVGDEGFRYVQAFNLLVVLAQPVEGDVGLAVVAQAPLGARGQEA